MAVALGLPAVMGAAGLMAGIESGDMVVVDGRRGRVIVNPSATTLEEFGTLREELRRAQRQLARLRRLPAVTRDGIEIKLNANVELPRELDYLRFSNVIQHTVNPIQITDASGKLVDVNPAFEKASGYAKDELIGRKPRILSSGTH